MSVDQPRSARTEALLWLELYRDLGIEEVRALSPGQQLASTGPTGASVPAPAAAAPAQPSLLDIAGPDAAAIAEAVAISDRIAALAHLEERVIGACTRCRLHEARTHVVFGVGNPHARLMFVGEGPGADEDRQGEPFVGRAGQLLDKIIQAMGLARADVYIANVVKSRPPENRTPLPDEVATCLPFLLAQIQIVKPEVLVALGRSALEALTGQIHPSITRARGLWLEHRGIPVKATFHPAYLLRNPAAKRPVWEDMQDVMQRLGLPGKPES